MESSIDSPIETVVKLLGKWRTEGRLIHCCFRNNWEGWVVNGLDSFDSIEIIDDSLIVKFADWSLSFAVGKIDEVSIVDSRLPEGMEPASVEVAYISDASVLVKIEKADDAETAHSFLSFSAIVNDESNFVRA